MRKFFFNVLLLLIIVAYTATAAQTPYNFLRYVSGARSGALSNTMVAAHDDIEGVFFNPAIIATLDSTNENINVTFIKHILDINSGLIAYKLPLNEEWGHFALSTSYTSYGDFNYADDFGNLVGGTFGANDFNFVATYANKIDTNFYWGVSAKFIYIGIEDAASTAMAIDAGLLYTFDNERTALGLSVLHAGFVMSNMNGYDASLPLDVRFGFNHRLQGLPLLFSASIHHLADDYDSFLERFKSFSIGGEFNFGENFFVRVGYDNQVRNVTNTLTSKGLNGFSGGLGLKTDYVDIDYGINQYGAGALLHRISLEFDIR